MIREESEVVISSDKEKREIFLSSSDSPAGWKQIDSVELAEGKGFTVRNLQSRT